LTGKAERDREREAQRIIAQKAEEEKRAYEEAAAKRFKDDEYKLPNRFGK
jgi:ferritin-like protein